MRLGRSEGCFWSCVLLLHRLIVWSADAVLEAATAVENAALPGCNVYYIGLSVQGPRISRSLSQYIAWHEVLLSVQCVAGGL